MAESTLVVESGTHEIIVTRMFDALPELVFRITMDPELIPQWWGPAHLHTVVDKMDVRPGGQWRFVQTDPDGNEYAFNGVYHSIEVPNRIIQTFEWEGLLGHVSLETITLEEVDGKTKMTEQSVFQSIEDRDGMLANGMEGAADEMFDRLEALLVHA
ncbi:MAG: SRPBCC family protein [Chloroflexota bacterium]